MLENMKNICDKETLQAHLTYIALFIGVYEFFADTIQTRVESFLCDKMVSDEKKGIKYLKSIKYKEQIQKRIVDENGNKDILKASMLWFQDSGAISETDYQTFLSIKEKRNTYTHQMTEHLWNGLPPEDAQFLVDLLNLYTKIDQWWINEIEIPIAGDSIPDDYQRDGVQSFPLLMFKMMINTLYFEKTDEYMNLIENVHTQSRD